MNSTERFFRRYIFSSIGIVVLFLIVNVLLIGSYLAVAYLENVADSNFPIENLSNHITLKDGQLVGDEQATEMLNKANAWAMILDGDGAGHLGRKPARKIDISLFVYGHCYV